MMKYTIIYSEHITGFPGQHITCYKRIETDDLNAVLQSEQYSGNVWFIFEGWPELEKS